jgi:hypothetical protein
MFEAIFRITAQVESDAQGRRIYRIMNRGEPPNDSEFSSNIVTMYQQEVFRTLQPGDGLTTSVRLDGFPARELERNVRFREDHLFEGDGIPQPTADLLPLLQQFYEPLIQQVNPGDVITITFRIERL